MEKPSKFNMIRTYSPADFLTLGNAAFGTIILFICLRYVESGSQKGVLWPVFVCFFLALVCDFLDGYVARKSKRSSLLGEDLDSLADVISFGVAPAVLAYSLGMRGFWDSCILVYFVLCGVSRLARFNATSNELKGASDKVSHFEGTPIPTSLLLVLILGIAFMQGKVGNQLWLGSFSFLGSSLHPLVLMYLLSGTAMISSRLKIPKF